MHVIRMILRVDLEVESIFLCLHKKIFVFGLKKGGYMKHFKASSFLVLLLGIMLGAGALAGSQYVIERTNERAFCASCHIMLPASVSNKMSLHADLACNDCHLPHDNVVNYLFTKAKLGATDIYLNTVGDYDLPIMSTAEMKTTIMDNCIRCHRMTNMNVAVVGAKDSCVSCHRNVPHQRMKPIDARMVGYE